MKRFLCSLLFILFSFIAASAQRVYVLYTNGVPTNCVTGNLYVDRTTGNIYSWKLGIGCIISGNVNGVSGSGVSGRISYWNGVSSLTSITGFTFDGLNLSIPTGGQFRINGTAFNFSNLAGNINVSQMNSGTSASSTTFWRGDGTWATPVSVNPTSGNIPYNNGGSFADSGLFQGTNLIEQRNSTNSQTFRIYNTFTDTSNYERAEFVWTGNVFKIQTTAAGTGTQRELRLDAPGSGGFLAFYTGTSPRWIINSSGNLVGGIDNSYDIGANGANRPRNLYIAGTGNFGSTINATGYQKSGTTLSLSGVLSMGNSSGQNISGAATSFNTFGVTNSAGITTFSVTENTRQLVIPVTGTLTNFYIITNSGQPADGSLVCTIRINSVNTSIVATVAAGTAAGTFSDTTHTASITAGSLLSYQCTNNSPATGSAALTQWAIAIQ